MKSLLIVSARRSSGSTTLTCLLARHLQSAGHRRVLVLDLAEPAGCARLLADRSCATPVACNVTHDAEAHPSSTAGGSVRVLDANAVDGLRVRDDHAHTRYYANLRHLLATVAPWFDICLIDAPVLPDLRAVCAEALVDAAVSPIAVTPACIDCALEVINGTYGIRNVRARLNPALRFAGLLPVMTNRASMEGAWARVMETTLREWLIPDTAFPHGYALLPRIAQGTQRDVTRLASTSSSCGAAAEAQSPDASRIMTACLNAIALRLDAIPGGTDPVLRSPEVCDA